MTAYVTLQLSHASHDLTKLAAALALPVARIWLAGADRFTPRGDPLEGQYQESYVALKVGSSPGTIIEAIEVIRQAFLAMPADLLQSLHDPSLQKYLYCTLESGGEELNLDALRTLVDLKIELGVD